MGKKTVIDSNPANTSTFNELEKTAGSVKPATPANKPRTTEKMPNGITREDY